MCHFVSLSPLHQYKPEGLAFRMDQAWPSLQGPFKDDLTLCVEEEFTTYQFLKISRSHNWVLWLSQIRVITTSGCVGQFVTEGTAYTPPVCQTWYLLIFFLSRNSPQNSINACMCKNFCSVLKKISVKKNHTCNVCKICTHCVLKLHFYTQCKNLHNLSVHYNICVKIKKTDVKFYTKYAKRYM